MFIYNTTFIVEKILNNQFLDFLSKEYIPKALSNNYIDEPRLSLIHVSNEEGGLSYALEFKVTNIELLETWNIEIGKELNLLLMTKFRQRVLSFSTILQPIHL